MPSRTESDPQAKKQVARIKRNQRAIALLRKWRQADDDEQRETWEFLKEALDQDRLSARKLFTPS